MHIVFYSTSLVFEAEEKLKENNIECKIVPTPVSDKAYCGVCVQTEVLELGDLLEGMEYYLVD